MLNHLCRCTGARAEAHQARGSWGWAKSSVCPCWAASERVWKAAGAFVDEGAVQDAAKMLGRASGLEFFILFLMYDLKIGILTLVWIPYPAQSPLQPPGSPAKAEGMV